MLKRALQAAAVSTTILAAIVLMAQTRRAGPDGLPHNPPQLQAISVHTSPNGTVIIDVDLTQAVHYRTFELSSPNRFVLDLEGAHKGVSKRVYPADSPLLERVRVGQWRTDPAVARVVADLKGYPGFSIRRQGSQFRIELKARESADRREDRPRRNRPLSARGPSQNRREAYTAWPDQKSPFTVHRFKDLSASLTGPELPSQDKLVPVSRPGDEPPPAGSPSLSVVSGISIRPDVDGKTLVYIPSSRSVPYRVFQLSDPYRLVIDLKDAHDDSRQDVYPVDSSVLKRIRMSQWRPGDPAVVRVVADLEGYPIFDVHAERPGIQVELSPRTKLGPLIRNPFEFATPQYGAQRERAARQSNHAMTTEAGSAAAAPGNSFARLKVIGFIEQKDAAVQAVISDHASIYFVPNGGTFENTYRVIAISPNAVEVQNIETLDSGWLAYTP